MRILIAEDNATSRRLLRRILETDPDNEVGEAEDGLAAWLLLEQGWWPKLCLLDIQMPRLDGFELLQRLRGDIRFKDIPVLLCSSQCDRPSITQAASLGVQHFIAKPYSLETVMDRVRRVKDGLTGPSVLGDAEAICARLGIERSTLLALLNSLLRDLDGTVQIICAALDPRRLSTVEVRVNSLAGAAAELSANSLHHAAEQLGVMLKGECEFWDKTLAIAGTDQASRFQEWFHANRPAVLEHVVRLKQEGVRLREAMSQLRRSEPVAA